jgi:hypothetical protein
MGDKDGGPAFPRPVSGLHPLEAYVDSQSGMTLRDYFAGQALITLRPQQQPDDTWHPNSIRSDIRFSARWAYKLADAMLRVRERGDC